MLQEAVDSLLDNTRRANAVKADGNRPLKSLSDLKGLGVSFPFRIEEQKAIAGILSDMDAEIQSLQEKRSKYEKVKQGMMQELLTGKTRLV